MKKTLDSSYGRQKKGTSGSGKTALVLSGGGSRGAYQCGAWRALIELGIPVDMVCRCLRWFFEQCHGSTRRSLPCFRTLA